MEPDKLVVIVNRDTFLVMVSAGPASGGPESNQDSKRHKAQLSIHIVPVLAQDDMKWQKRTIDSTFDI